MVNNNNWHFFFKGVLASWLHHKSLLHHGPHMEIWKILSQIPGEKKIFFIFSFVMMEMLLSA